MPKYFLIFAMAIALTGCFSARKQQTAQTENTSFCRYDPSETKKLVDQEAPPPPKHEYKAAATKRHELINTKLDISFDILNQKVFGKANLLLRPYFYATDLLVLDAKEFDINKINLIKNKQIVKPLEYQYDGEKITIQTPKYTRQDTFEIQIDYIANPSEMQGEGQGLYFQDYDTDNPQIWTQGEPNCSSAWFPTIDAPNQRMSQEIVVTVDTSFTTLSNGVRDAVLLNNDGTKTVRWIQKKPHAPYLTALIVGRFEVKKDYWRGKPVFIYFEKEHAKSAPYTFKNTARMIEFFSRKLQYDYPWDKYSQVVVRNYFEGAMENTGAVVFSKAELYSPIEDRPMRPVVDETVSHELFHHWFGDLVTCESWANTALNEAFATYGSYLWIEHEYGRYAADKYIYKQGGMYNLVYLIDNSSIVNYYHKSPDDMFNIHSYQKGALTLHSLRYEVGDEAFFEAISRYLKKHAFSSVELADLRICFEEVTGRDLNYFFDAMFLDKGRMNLDIKYLASNDSLNWTIDVKQIQKERQGPLYKLHVPVDFYMNDTIIRKTVLLDKKQNKYTFSFDKKIKLAKFDAENSLLCKKKENRTIDDYLYILKHVNRYIDQIEATNVLDNLIEDEDVAYAYLSLLDNSYYMLRLIALETIPIKKNTSYFEKYKNKLSQMATNDPDKEIREAAKKILAKL